MTTKTQFNASSAVPCGLTDVALIDAQACAAASSMSVSWWHAEVAAGRAPVPAIRKPRCTRWRLADVRAWLIQVAAQPNNEGPEVIARATRASRAAREKRATGINHGIVSHEHAPMIASVENGARSS